MTIFGFNCFDCKQNLETGCLIIGGLDIITNILWIIFITYFYLDWHKVEMHMLDVEIILTIFQIVISIVLIIGIKKKKPLYIDFWMFNIFMNLSIQSLEICVHIIQLFVYDEHLGDVIIELMDFVPTLTFAFLVPFVRRFKNKLSFEHQLLQSNNDLQLNEDV